MTRPAFVFVATVGVTLLLALVGVGLGLCCALLARALKQMREDDTPRHVALRRLLEDEK